MVSSTAWIHSLKALVISTGVLILALFLRVSVPLLLDFSVSRAPGIWSSLLSWLKPPYLYVVINGIIISIAASSRFHRSSREEEDCMDQPSQIHPPTTTVSVNPHLTFGFETKERSVFGLVEPVGAVYEEKQDEAKVSELERTVPPNEVEAEAEAEEKTVVVDDSVGDGGDEFVISRSSWNPQRRMNSSDVLSEYLSSPEKPPVSSRFGHRKPVKASPEGGRAAVLRVAKPKRQETLENTWKAITEGRAMPLTRHLKKSDTWENHGRHVNVGEANLHQVKKSETFKDRTNNYQSPEGPEPMTPSPVKLRKEPSLSQDELNRRVEAFIKKFNEEMRLQRQESLNQYKEMISRGV